MNAATMADFRVVEGLEKAAAFPRNPFRLTDRELKRYSLSRAILTSAENMEVEKDGNSFELEVSAEIERRTPGKKHGGVFVPWQIRAGLDTSTSTKGAELKFTEPGTFIEFLYNQMRVKELGATTVSGLQGNVAYPKQTGKVSGAWVGENPGSDVADSNLTLGQVPTSPKTYQSSTSYSRQLLAQAVVDVDTMVREDLARDMALAADLAAIAGTGSSNQPTGILHTSGITSYVNATEATTNNPGYDDVVHMIEQLEDTNADQLGNPGFLTTPSMKSYFKLLPRLANAIALPAWTDDDELAGYMARSTNQVPKTGNTTHHTGSDQHALILGVWRTLVLSTWGDGFELIVDPFRLKKQGMIELTTFTMMDVALKYAPAFVVSENAPV